MLPTERITRFFVKLVVVYALLVAPWPGIMKGYAALHRGLGNALFGSLGSVGTSRFLPLTGNGKAFDSQIVLRTRDAAGVRSTRNVSFHTRRTGYLPTAELLALILATSIPWRRRWKALAWGVLSIATFIAIEAGITILYSLTDERMPAVSVGPLVSKACAELYEIVVVSPTVSLVVPVLIWMLVCFRGGDWSRTLSEPGGQETSRNGIQS